MAYLHFVTCGKSHFSNCAKVSNAIFLSNSTNSSFLQWRCYHLEFFFLQTNFQIAVKFSSNPNSTTP